MYKEISSIGLTNGSITYHKMARIISMEASALKDIVRQESTKGKTRVVVATAGTTDLPVAEEAAVTLEAAGCKVDRIFDAGVAGTFRPRHCLSRSSELANSCCSQCTYEYQVCTASFALYRGCVIQMSVVSLFALEWTGPFQASSVDS